MPGLYKLLFIENPHDANSQAIRAQLEQANIQEEKHFISFADVPGLPISAAPCVYVIGMTDLQETFTADDVLTELKHIKERVTITERLDYLGKIAVKARLQGIK